MKRSLKKWSMAAGAGVLILGTGIFPVPADVVTYDNGKILKGIVEEIPGDPGNVMMTTADRKLKIPRARITDIQRETPAQGHLHIGRDYRSRKMMSQAIAEFQKALDMDPNNADARRELDATQTAINEMQSMKRGDAVKQVDTLADQAKTLVDNREFEKAEGVIKQANDLVPNAEQRDRLAKQLSNLYLAWAEDRLDKFDKPGAEDKLNYALAANPNNTAVVDHLLKLWKDDPEKRESLAAVYETILAQHPENDTMRKELGDLYFQMRQYQQASNHYIKLYSKNAEYKGTEMEQRLITTLGALHLKEARDKDYDNAIYHYKLLSSIDPQTDPTAVIYYEFLKMSAGIPQDDLNGQLKLAGFAEQNGLDEEAKEIYKRLTQFDKSREGANAGLHRYAARIIQEAQAQLNAGNVSLAQVLASQMVSDYPTAKDLEEEARRIIGLANAEIQRQKRNQKESAKFLLERGDQFYETAMMNYSALYSTERTERPGLGSARAEAKKYFTYAIDAYNQAINADPSLKSDSRSIVMVRLTDATDKLRRLSGAPTSYRQQGRSPEPKGSVTPFQRQ